MAFYLQEKYIHELHFESYISDCLWLQATGKIIKEIPRYTDQMHSRDTQRNSDEKTGDEILAETIAAFERLGE